MTFIGPSLPIDGPLSMVDRADRYDGEERRDRGETDRSAPPSDGGPSAGWTTKQLVGALLSACGLVAVSWVVSVNSASTKSKDSIAELRADVALVSQRVGTLEKQMVELQSTANETDKKAAVLIGLIEAQNRSRSFTNESLPRPR